jgi:hypothetical protein
MLAWSDSDYYYIIAITIILYYNNNSYCYKKAIHIYYYYYYKYKAACDANGLELLSICIESTGARWGKACDDFFRKVLKANSIGNESVYRASSNNWLSRLSCCLQKSIAASIVNRSKLINGDMLHNPTRTINLMRTLSSNPDFDISILTSTMIFSPCLE